MLHAGVREAAANFAALVVGNDGAELLRRRQPDAAPARGAGGQLGRDRPDGPRVPGATQALRYADVPVVVAPAGLALGGGCEIALHGDRVQAAAESYIGLVEVGVGPDSGRRRHQGDAGARGSAVCPRAHPTCCRSSSGCSRPSASPRCRRAPRTPSASASSRDADRVTMNRERLMADAKASRSSGCAKAISAPPPRTAIPVGGDSDPGRAQARRPPGVAGRAHQRPRRGRRPGARRRARGRRAAASDRRSAKQYLLDLEREAFLKLCGERKTLERIQHTLKTGKPLRN